MIFVLEISLWHFHICLQCTLVSFILTTILPHSPLPYLKLFQCRIFKHIYKVCGPYSPSFTLFIHPPPSPRPLLLTGPVLYSCPSFFKHMFIFQRGFAKEFYQRIYCAFFDSCSSLSFPCTSFQSVSLWFLPTQMHCISILFILYHNLFPSLLPQSTQTIPLL
jgi:hypothetical protein